MKLSSTGVGWVVSYWNILESRLAILLDTTQDRKLELMNVTAIALI